MNGKRCIRIVEVGLANVLGAAGAKIGVVSRGSEMVAAAVDGPDKTDGMPLSLLPLTDCAAFGTAGRDKVALLSMHSSLEDSASIKNARIREANVLPCGPLKLSISRMRTMLLAEAESVSHTVCNVVSMMATKSVASASSNACVKDGLPSSNALTRVIVSTLLCKF